MSNRISLQQHVTDPQLRELLSTVADACVAIEANIRIAGLSTILGAAGHQNVQGEQQQKLDVFANDALTDALRKLPAVAAIISEEDDEPIVLSEDDHARYLVIFDPLDGSSNIDVNVNVGTIVSITERTPGQPVKDAMLQAGTRQVAALYVVYGPSTILVYTTGKSTNGFTLDPKSDEFVLSHPEMRMPEQGPYYSANEANQADFPAPFQKAIDGFRDGSLLGAKYSTRYVGSLIADVHRTLLKGGVFLYPPTAKAPKGKLRLLYEANPMAFIVEAAGGMATNGSSRILETQPTEPHQRTPLVIGGKAEVSAIQKLVEAAAKQ